MHTTLLRIKFQVMVLTCTHVLVDKIWSDLTDMHGSTNHYLKCT